MYLYMYIYITHLQYYNIFGCVITTACKWTCLVSILALGRHFRRDNNASSLQYEILITTWIPNYERFNFLLVNSQNWWVLCGLYTERLRTFLTPFICKMYQRSRVRCTFMNDASKPRWSATGVFRYRSCILGNCSIKFRYLLMIFEKLFQW